MIPERFSCRIYGVLQRGRKILLTRSVFCRLHEHQKVFSSNTPEVRPCRHEGGLEFVNFPGGGVELGEAPMEALRREYFEETGLAIKPVRVLYASEGRHISSQLPLQIVSVYWLVRRTSGTLKMRGNGDDILHLFWSDLDAISTDEMFPSDREFSGVLPSLLKV